MDDIKGNVIEFIKSCENSRNDLYNEFDPRIRKKVLILVTGKNNVHYEVVDDNTLFF